MKVAGRYADPADAVERAAGGERTAEDSEGKTGAAFQGQRRGGRGSGNSGQSVNALHGIADEARGSRRCLKRGVRERHAKGQNVVRVEARIDRAKVVERANEESGADQEHNGDSGFAGDKKRPGFILAEAPTGAGRAFVERRSEIGTRCAKRGDDPKQNASGKR